MDMALHSYSFTVSREQEHRVTEQFSLEGTSGSHLVQTSSQSRAYSEERSGCSESDIADIAPVNTGVLWNFPVSGCARSFILNELGKPQEKF